MRKIIFCIKQFLLSVVRLFFSFVWDNTECTVCGNKCLVLPVCAACAGSYFQVKDVFENICNVCGRFLVSEHVLCTECRKEPLLKSTDGVFPLYSYRLWNTELLCCWKLEGERALSSFFAMKIHERLVQLGRIYSSFAVVPVPPRPGKIRREGWDQVDELCSFLEYYYNYDVRRILVRKSCVEQKSLNRQGRLGTIGHSYFIDVKIKKLPETVCLVDDVITTGATAESCAGVLKAAGVKKVLVVSLFSVDD